MIYSMTGYGSSSSNIGKNKINAELKALNGKFFELKIRGLEINFNLSKAIKDYFSRPVLNMLVHQPLELTNKKMNVDTVITVSGGGLSGQAGAIRHGISKALSLLDPNLRSILKSEGLLTRDSRIVERKKYGRRKARRRYQFSKR